MIAMSWTEKVIHWPAITFASMASDTNEAFIQWNPSLCSRAEECKVDVVILFIIRCAIIEKSLLSRWPLNRIDFNIAKGNNFTIAKLVVQFKYDHVVL